MAPPPACRVLRDWPSHPPFSILIQPQSPMCVRSGPPQGLGTSHRLCPGHLSPAALCTAHAVSRRPALREPFPTTSSGPPLLPPFVLCVCFTVIVPMCSYTMYSSVQGFILSHPLERSSVGQGTVLFVVGDPDPRGGLARDAGPARRLGRCAK